MAIDDESAWVPDACALPTAERPLRVAEFNRLFCESLLESVRVDDTRLDLVLDATAEAAARDLAAREAACCSFFRFEFVSRDTDLVMSVGVPPAHTEVLDGLSERVAAAGGRENTVG